MTSAQIAEQIALVAEGVPNIGKVHRYDRFFRDLAGFELHHKWTDGQGAGVLGSATVTLSGMGPGATNRSRTGGTSASTRLHRYSIRIIRGQHDDTASQLILGDLAQALFDAFEAQATRTTLAALGIVYTPLEVDPIGIVGYGNPAFVAVNQAMCTLTIEEVLG